MKKLIIFSIVFVFLFGSMAYALGPGDETDPTVYVKEKGKKYHKKSCKLVAQGKKGINLSEAVSKGYTPCAKCKPVDPTVYIKEKGKKYHKKKFSDLKIAYENNGVKLSEAIKLGLQPCKACLSPPSKKK